MVLLHILYVTDVFCDTNNNKSNNSDGDSGGDSGGDCDGDGDNNDMNCLNGRIMLGFFKWGVGLLNGVNVYGVHAHTMSIDCARLPWYR